MQPVAMTSPCARARTGPLSVSLQMITYSVLALAKIVTIFVDIGEKERIIRNHYLILYKYVRTQAKLT